MPSTCFEHCCAHHQEVKIVLYSIWYRHTCRWPSRARGVHVSSTAVLETCNKLIIKQEFVH